MTSLRSRPPEQPVRALANDNWVGFASEVVYKYNATYLEILMASPSILSVVCFVLEVQRPKENDNIPYQRNVFGERAHMQRYRTGARGNVTLFPLPLEDIYRHLKHLAKRTKSLPLEAKELSNVVRVIIKSATMAAAKEIVAATVRRHVVQELVFDLKRRGHPAYVALEVEDVRARCAKLPKHGPLPELLSLVDHNDASLEKLIPMKILPQGCCTSLQQMHLRT